MLLPFYERGYLPAPDGAAMPYLIVGDGPVRLVLIPGAGDGLRTVYDWAEPIAWALRKRAARYTTLLISRRNPLPAGCSAEGHADDCIAVIEALRWGPAILEGNSAGGPIAQWIAVKRPDLVKGLILTGTLHQTVPATAAILRYWLDLAQRRRWDELNWSRIEYSFSPAMVARVRPWRGFLRLLPRPNDPQRPERVFEELLGLDQRAILPQIGMPALVIGGAEDRVIGPAVQREMAELIPSSRLLLYPGFGHYNDRENPDYLVQVDRFVREVWPSAAAPWAARDERPGPRLAPRTLAAGALAGLIATVPMSALMGLLFPRLPRSQRYPLPPAEITRNSLNRLGLTARTGSPGHALLTTLGHFGYGGAMGALYAPVAASTPRVSPAAKGIAWGLAVWLASYLGLLPALRLLPPATQHPRRRNLLMIGAHLTWGIVLGISAAWLAKGPPES